MPSTTLCRNDERRIGLKLGLAPGLTRSAWRWRKRTQDWLPVQRWLPRGTRKTMLDTSDALGTGQPEGSGAIPRCFPWEQGGRVEGLVRMKLQD
jgi:hypothetical protein